ncbi:MULTISPECIES: glycosyltransferase [unclassified Pseudomonas]|uniref:glycosyltransferase n=1 Tax=unclassified Pseudomonas TaxID=196821 RepID=UPI001304CEB3|nr:MULTISPECIES: glycosyltransferase [unclassified Pseudomonas]
MKVLHVAETIKGGVATIARQLMLSQISSGLESTCLVPKTQAVELISVPLKNIETYNSTGRNIPSLLKFIVALSITLHTRRPDIVHLHSTFAGLCGRLILFFMLPFYRPKIIYCPHGWAFIMDGGNAKKRAFALIERLLLKITDTVICVSKFEQEAALSQGFSKEKIIIVNNCVEPPQPVQAINHFDRDVVNLLYVGRFDHAKGFDTLVDAMALLEGHPFRLTAVGDTVQGGPPPKKLNNINYVGWLHPSDLAGYFSNADVLIMPSRWESFGLVAAEAHSYGLPVVASRCCSLPEVVAEGVTGFLFEPGSSRELVALLKRIPRSTWSKLGRNSYERYEAKFKSEIMCTAVLNIYNNSPTSKKLETNEA